MFLSIDNKLKEQENKLIQIEKKATIKMYIYGLKNKNYNILDNYTIQYKVNQEYLNEMKDLLILNNLNDMCYLDIKKMFKKINLNSQILCTALLERMINEKDYLKAKKMIILMKKKEFYSYKINALTKKYLKQRQVNIKYLEDAEL
ncbi:hypothetical protein GVAV_002093 [Gurleya vavrai]